MPHRYLLDTSIVSDLIRQPQGKVAARIASAGEDTVCTSIVAAAERRYGARRSASRKLADRVDLILSALDVLPLETPADRHYGVIRQRLTRPGKPIGPNDLLIAAHALALNLTVVTPTSGRLPACLASASRTGWPIDCSRERNGCQHGAGVDRPQMSSWLDGPGPWRSWAAVGPTSLQRGRGHWPDRAVF